MLMSLAVGNAVTSGKGVQLCCLLDRVLELQSRVTGWFWGRVLWLCQPVTLRPGNAGPWVCCRGQNPQMQAVLPGHVACVPGAWNKVKLVVA